MSTSSMSKSERLLAQIKALKKEVSVAKKRERDERRRGITRAAIRAGLDTLGLSTNELETEFRRIVEMRGHGCVYEDQGEDEKQGIGTVEQKDEQQEQEAGQHLA